MKLYAFLLVTKVHAWLKHKSRKVGVAHTCNTRFKGELRGGIDYTCSNMCSNTRIKFCIPSEGQEVSPRRLSLH